MTLRPLWTVAAGLALLGCGENAADEGFLGEVVAGFDFEVGPNARPDGEMVMVDYPENLRVALFWHVDGIDGDVDRLIEQPSTGIYVTDRINAVVVRERPPEGTVVDDLYAIGRLVAYIDADRDGRLSVAAGETMYSGLDNDALVLALRDIEAGEGPFVRPVPAGLFRQALPLLCGTQPATDATCAAPLGADCDPDAPACGAAECRYTLPETHPEAAPWCVARHTTGGCVPPGGRLLPGWDGDPDVVTGLVAPACDSSSDCAGLAARGCDVMHGACRARTPPLVAMPGPRALVPLCSRDDGPDVLELAQRTGMGDRDAMRPPGGGG